MPPKQEPGAASSEKDHRTHEPASILTSLHFHAPSGGVASIIQAASSILFKFAVYVFLRWIPTSLAYPVIPTLYAVYVLTSVYCDYTIRSAISAHLAKKGARDLQQLADKVEVTDSKIQTKPTAKPVENKTKDQNGGTPTKAASSSVSYAEVAKGAKAAPTSTSSSTSTAHAAENAKLRRTSPLDLLKAIVFGTSTRSTRLNFYIVLAHTLAFAIFLDSFLSPYLFPSHWDYNLSFARTGALGPTYAKIHIRYPPPELAGAPEASPAMASPLTSALNSLTTDPALRTAAEQLENHAQPIELLVKYRRAINATQGDNAFLSASRVYGKQYLANHDSLWLNGPLITLRPENDWTATAFIDELWPSTTYEWGLSQFQPEHVDNSDEVRVIEKFVANDDISRRNFFTTWPDPRLSSYMQSQSLGSRNIDLNKSLEGEPVEESNPLEDPNHFTFASTSCVKPDFPYHPAQFWGWNWILRLIGIGTEEGGITERNRIPGFDLLYKRTVAGRESHPSIRFLLQLGDSIYADVPHYGGAETGAYRKLYRNLFASKSFRRFFKHVPVIGIYDDHEVINNWSGKDENDEEIAAYPSANTAWKEYIGDVNPEPLEAGENYYTFQYGESAAFFVMDTRRHRTHHTADDDEDKTMLGYRQKEDLYRWLSAVNETAAFKFVVSSVPFNTLWGGELDVDGQKDSWAAYNTERLEIAEVLRYVPNVIVLSGDRHEFAAVSVLDTITEFSTSPLSMFYLPVRTLSQDHGDGKTGVDKLLKYLPDGNYKWTEFEVDARDPYKPVVRVSVQIDGKEAWKTTYVGKSLRKSQGGVGGLVRNLLESLGFRFDFFYKA
ncbi:Alkaline phosphatase D-related [Kalmanozyma brasiliensis GHG001]|uniref:Alkaline phosphatase n=1 Tax=Kalmanozyma brasiliensis (strain GHG001) TaxID=1365824 RepID=V5EZ41_KALBG|nr:Alkaline phosphatase D-related [Kalmanozyma brasiliensis GHG001]EST08084.1 Alkaline phosphatase D-related [Kalmanozyma brasiliensis GHG001]